MADPICDFVPDECAALAIQLCLLAKKCKLNDLGLPGLQEQFGGTEQLNLQFRLKLDEAAQCILDALRAAFEAAGCPFPTALPQPPSPPDLQSCAAQLQSIAADASDPLGFLSNFMTIQLDANDKPVRITVP